MGRRKSLTRQVQEQFKDMLHTGESRHEAKKKGKAYKNIYSTGTYKTYLKQAIAFTEYCKAKHGAKTLNECKGYAQEYIDACTERGDSAYSIKTYAAAIRKLYNEKGMTLQTPKRDHRDIKRSRGDKIRDEGFNEAKNGDLVYLCTHTGLRRHEAAKITGDALQSDGTILVKGKGGKIRAIQPTGDTERIRAMFTNAKHEKLFDGIPSHADIHGYRRQFAQNLYEDIARDTDTLTHDEIYFTRDGTHRRYDKAALLYVSQQLGHNRESVTAVHYVR